MKVKAKILGKLEHDEGKLTWTPSAATGTELILSTAVFPPKRPFTIGCSGVPGSGKTTFARALSTEIRIRGLTPSVEYVDEYARAYIAKYGPVTDLWEQIRIYNKQLQAERKFYGTCSTLVCDSPVFMGFMYSTYLQKRHVQKDSMLMADLFNEMIKLNTSPHYDVIFHLPPILSPTEDGVRKVENFDSEWREQSDSFIRTIFKLFPPVHYVVLDDTVQVAPEQSMRSALLNYRLNTACNLLAKFMEQKAVE